MRTRIVLLAALSVMAFVTVTHPRDDVPVNISMIELIANPEKFSGKPVLVTGYLTLEHEGDMLYLSQNDYLHGIPKNGLWVERTAEMTRDIEKLDSNYVLLVGIFNPSNKGHRSMASGSIEKVRSCTFWSKPGEPISIELRRPESP